MSAPATDAAQPAGLPQMVRALRSRNYRLFFGGQFLSLLGSWLTNVATPWLVYRTTNDPAMLGIVGFAGQVPAFLLAPAAGVLVDRWNLRRTLVVTQSIALLQSAALAVLAFSNTISITWIIVIYISRGIINAIDIPCRQAFVPEMVDRREDLANAIALNSSMFNSARLLGPSIAGVLIAISGEAMCFALDSISFVAVISSLLMMSVPPRPRRPHAQHVLADLAEGVRYTWKSPPIKAVLINLALVTLASVPLGVLMPVFAKDILHGGPTMLGTLMAASGIGALAGGLALAARRSVWEIVPIIPLATMILGAALIAFGLSHWLWLSLPLVTVTGFCALMQTASSNTLVQTLVDDDKRGRVMSLFVVCFQGMMPLGALFAGLLAKTYLGPGRTLVLSGLACIAAALAFLPRVAPVQTHLFALTGPVEPCVPNALPNADPDAAGTHAPGAAAKPLERSSPPADAPPADSDHLADSVTPPPTGISTALER